MNKFIITTILLLTINHKWRMIDGTKICTLDDMRRHAASACEDFMRGTRSINELDALNYNTENISHQHMIIRNTGYPVNGFIKINSTSALRKLEHHHNKELHNADNNKKYDYQVHHRTESEDTAADVIYFQPLTEQRKRHRRSHNKHRSHHLNKRSDPIYYCCTNSDPEICRLHMCFH